MDGGKRKRKVKQEGEEPASEDGTVGDNLQSLFIMFPRIFSCSSSKEEIQKG